MKDVLARLKKRQDEMVTLLDILVSCESPSADVRRLAQMVELLTQHGTRLLEVAPTRSGPADAPVLRWDLPAAGAEPGRSADPVMLLGHLDTVWPAGTIDRWPFSVSGDVQVGDVQVGDVQNGDVQNGDVRDGDRATGPGAFDMKAGLVQALFALAELTASDAPRPPVIFLVTSDEEIGSDAGRPVLEEAARGCSAVLVLEASLDGALKVARKGVANYTLRIAGRAAHAGLEPEKGVNALVAAARLVIALEDLSAPELGTTVTPTLASAGTTQNTVPATASVSMDVRASTIAEQERVDAGLRELAGQLSLPGGATVTVEGVINRPPLEEALATELMDLARRAAARCGLLAPESAKVGGASDGNFTAALGVRTLDGLGAVGGGAHAEGEWVLVTAMPERAALLAALIVELGVESEEADA